MELESTTKRSPPERTRQLPGPLNAELVAGMRVAFGLAAQIIIGIEPPRPPQLAALTFAAVGLYALYGIALYVAIRLRKPPSWWRSAYWVDAAWYLLIIALSGGANSIFFIFLLFSILVASFTDGFRAGLSVSLVSTTLFAGVSLVTLPPSEDFEINRFLVRLITLILLGYMFSYWGDSELKLRSRLALLRDINDFSNPRFGIDRTLGYTMDKIRAGLNADRCLLVTADHVAEIFRLRSCSSKDVDGAVTAESIPEGFASQLLSLPDNAALVYPEGGGALSKVWRWVSGTPAGNGAAASKEAAERLANIFEAESFLSVPARFGDGLSARFYLFSQRPRAFEDSDAAFVEQTLSYIIPIIENVRLVDQLASTAAEHERQKIARDIHDSVVQPYVGLRIGLIGVRQKLESGLDATADLNRLIELSEAEISDLRSYMGGLKGRKDQANNLLSAIQRFTAKIAAATKLDLEIKAVGNFRVNDRLAAEIFQLVTEALSNIRRHTMAKRAIVALEVNDEYFCLDIENDGWEGAPTDEFTPRSIKERVGALGGELIVRRAADGGAHLHIEIPL